MCPACIATTFLVLAGSASAGGVGALFVQKRVRGKAEAARRNAQRAGVPVKRT